MVMMIIVILILPLKTQKYIFLQQPYQQKTIKNYQTYLQKDLKDPFIQNEYKAEKHNKNTVNEFRYFLVSSFVGVNRLFVLVYSNEDAACKRFKAKSYCSPNGTINNYNVVINEKNVYDQAIGSYIKRYKEIRKLTTG